MVKEEKPIPVRRSQNQECEWCGSIGPWGQVTSVTGISKSERDMKIKIEIGDPVTLCDTCLGIKWE